MKLHTINRYPALRRTIGDWAFVRFLRNQGYSFEFTYYAMFGRQPRAK